MTEDNPTETTTDEAVDTSLEDETTEPHAEHTEDDSADDSGAERPESTAPRQVRDLRREAANYRTQLRAEQDRARDLEQRLHAELVRSTGRLADPSDLAYDAEHLDDADALTAAIDELLESKPHLAKRTPRGSIGQGEGDNTPTTDLASILRARA